MNEIQWSALPSTSLLKQESCAIAKTTAQCVPHVGALKIFGTLTTPTVSSYRSSILTFSLSLRVSEILPLLFSTLEHATFSLPHLQSPQNFHMFPWDQVDRLSAAKSEGAGLVVRGISFQDFQPM